MTSNARYDLWMQYCLDLFHLPLEPKGWVARIYNNLSTNKFDIEEASNHSFLFTPISRMVRIYIRQLRSRSLPGISSRNCSIFKFHAFSTNGPKASIYRIQVFTFTSAKVTFIHFHPPHKKVARFDIQQSILLSYPFHGQQSGRLATSISHSLSISNITEGVLPTCIHGVYMYT